MKKGVGGVTKPRFVAEVSSNHNRDLHRSKAFISTAASIGCQAVKFQLFRVSELFAPEALRDNPELLARANWELPGEYLPELAVHARECGIEFACTPFHLAAVEQLEPYVHFYKIASYELLWNDLLRACAETGKPVVLSTGMAVMDEIDRAVEELRRAGCGELTLLHCVSGYPAPVEQCNLAVIDTLRRRFPGVEVGWSDHSVSEAVILRAVNTYGASMVEFHLDLEGRGDEFSAGHCWLPSAMRRVIENVEIGINAAGDGVKQPAPSELADRDWRADPADGLRPLRHVRAGLSGKGGKE
jgi:sialic acid synthase SpsE